ncbi:MAG: presenilin family intramembrane aspartyl protease [Candidatus Nanoarchaeia archaeon]|nr:presenilin family intramembrane aspartyl protease [Candidatus Nanoarchaeia archaeon]MDD5357670.1 presenilin family intramembrane aspartyl protease [Candidatus Nanoarchaeia archaeon]MDD5588589.1 presenilin family intramembrane aspartyl protease [Candidatus Nanoarchaeia archaeon]
MKHNIPMTILLLAMFVATQLIGLYIITSDPFSISQTLSNGTIETTENSALSWIQPPEVEEESDFGVYFSSIVLAFIFAVIILFLLTKFKVAFILRIWFFAVVAIALTLSFTALLPEFIYFLNPIIYYTIPAIISISLAFLKVFGKNFIVHNFTELLIYPGIATIFVPILNFWSILVLLLLISIYDIWAVWHSGIMQKMAKYQINNMKVFSGFFVPYISRKIRMRIKKMKKLKVKHKKIKVNVAILGGGDVVFPLITAGVILKTASVNLPFGLIFTGGLIPAIFVIVGATLGLALLFMFSEKKKFYPAMPFITGGILFGLVLGYFF